MRSIAVVLPNWVGDVVMATPALRALREAHPAARLHAVCRPYVAETLAGAPWFDSTTFFDRKDHSFFQASRRLADHRIDGAVLFPNSLRAALLVRVAGARTVAGFARYGRDALLTHRLYHKRGTGGRYEPSPVIDDYNRLAAAMGGAPDRRTELFTTPADEAIAAEWWGRLGLGGRVVGLNTGGAFGAAKEWPRGHFAALARRLAERGLGVVALCGPNEREAARHIAAEAGHPAVVSLADAPPSLGLTKAIVRRLSLLVTTDSGPRHFAPAFGVPVVTLFGPTHVGWTETYFAPSEHLQLKLPCGPCQQRTCPPGHHRCMTELTPDAALAASLRLLAAPPTERRRAC